MMPGTTPATAYPALWLTSAESKDDSKLTSTRWPWPVRSRCRSAAWIPITACSPVMTSTRATPTLVG